MVLKFLTPENVDYYDLTKDLFELKIGELMNMAIENNDESLFLAGEAKYMNPEEFKNMEVHVLCFKPLIYIPQLHTN